MSSCCKSSCSKSSVWLTGHWFQWELWCNVMNLCLFVFWMALDDWPDVKWLMNWMNGWLIGWNITDYQHFAWCWAPMHSVSLCCVWMWIWGRKDCVLGGGYGVKHLRPNCCTNRLLWRHGSGPLMCLTLNKRWAVKFGCFIFIYPAFLQM